MAELTPEQIEYKSKQRERMKTYVVGAKDSVGCVISHIYVKTDEYLIYDYDDANGKKIMRVFIDTETEDDPKDFGGHLAKVKPSFNKFKSVLYKTQNGEYAKSVAAQALSLALNGATGEAEAIISQLISDINSEHVAVVKCKMTFLLSCLVWIIVMSALGFILYLCREYQCFVKNSAILTIFYCFVFAGYGGFISVTRKMNNLIMEKDLNYKNYVAYAIERMVIANLSGIAAYVLIRSGIAFALVKEIKDPMYGFMAVSILSGFSENYIPDLLTKMESK